MTETGTDDFTALRGVTSVTPTEINGYIYNHRLLQSCAGKAFDNRPKRVHTFTCELMLTSAGLHDSVSRGRTAEKIARTECRAVYAVALSELLQVYPLKTMLSWYALEVTPRLCSVAATALEQDGHEVFRPMYSRPKQWADRVVYREAPLFPGYVLCRFDLNAKMRILMLPGVKNIVSYGRQPQPIEEQEIQNIRKAVESGLARPWRYLHVGQAVRIGDGPMRGLSGILVRTSSVHRVVVSITALRSSVAVEVDPRWLVPEASAGNITVASVGNRIGWRSK